MPRTKKFDVQKVLLKAIDLFWLQGYHATSIQDLVDHLGINRASLYDTYGGKWKLYVQALAIHMKNDAKRVEALLQKHENIIESLRTYLESITKNNDPKKSERGCFIVNSATELLPNSNYLAEMIESHRAKIISIINNRLINAVQEGQLAPDIDTLAISTSIFTYSSGLNVVSKVTNSSYEFEDMIDLFLEILA